MKKDYKIWLEEKLYKFVFIHFESNIMSVSITLWNDFDTSTYIINNTYEIILTRKLKKYERTIKVSYKISNDGVYNINVNFELATIL